MEQRRWEARLAFWHATTAAVAHHKPKDMPKHISDVFPDLFDRQEVDEEVMQQRFLTGVKRMNKQMKEE